MPRPKLQEYQDTMTHFWKSVIVPLSSHTTIVAVAITGFPHSFLSNRQTHSNTDGYVIHGVKEVCFGDERVF